MKASETVLSPEALKAMTDAMGERVMNTKIMVGGCPSGLAAIAETTGVECFAGALLLGLEEQGIKFSDFNKLMILSSNKVRASALEIRRQYRSGTGDEQKVDA